VQSARTNGARRWLLVAGVILSTHVILLAWSSYSHSPTVDEISHLISGIKHWRDGEFRYYPVNPPLVRLVATIPVMWNPGHVSDDELEPWVTSRPELSAGQEYLNNNGADAFSRFRWARYGCIPFSVLGGVVCFLWARRLYGVAAGMIALTLWSFSPTVLAFGALLLPDLAAASVGLVANYAFWRWLKRPTWFRTTGLGIVLGLAELTKFTWVVLFVLWPVSWLLSRRLKGDRTSYKEAVQLASSLSISFCLINLCYGFQGSFKPLGDYWFLSPALSGLSSADGHIRLGNRFSGTWVQSVPVPFPSTYISGIDSIEWEFSEGALSYLRGTWRESGWWYYYLYALAIKNPLGLFVLAALAMYVTFSRRSVHASGVDEFILLLPALAVLFVISAHTGVSHHTRYALPALPYAIIWASKVGSILRHRLTIMPRFVYVGLAWCISSSLWSYPHCLSYFNEAVGGPRNGHFHLGSSNVDYGQDLFYLQEWYEDNPAARPLHLGYSLDDLVDPRTVGVEWRPVPPGAVMNRPGTPRTQHWPWNDESRTIFESIHFDDDEVSIGPLPGWYAIAMNRIHSFDGRYEYFSEFTPVAWIGYSTAVYRLTVDECNQVRKKLGMAFLTEGAR
jgi:hypothetical protein